MQLPIRDIDRETFLRHAGGMLGVLLDATVVFSFGRTGFRLRKVVFRPSDLEVDMRGKVCLVTGASSALGVSAARALAQRGADVWLLCRNVERGRAARDVIQSASPAGSTVQLEQIDLSSLASVRAFAARFTAPRVDVLINNACVWPRVRTETADGIELTWANNVIGPFLLMHLLLPRLRAAGRARVINVSSGGVYAQGLSLDDVQWRQSPFDGALAYAHTKRAELVLTRLWAERLDGSGITVNSMHPGWADTPTMRAGLPRFSQLMDGRLRTPDEGADTVVWLAVSPCLQGQSGLFWFDRKARVRHWLPWTLERAADRASLWTLCCELAGLSQW